MAHSGFTPPRVREAQGRAAHQLTDQTIQAAHNQANMPVTAARGGANVPTIPVMMPATMRGSRAKSVVRVASGETSESRPVNRKMSGKVVACAPKLVASARARYLTILDFGPFTSFGSEGSK